MSPPYATEKSAQRRCRRATVSQHWLKFFFTVLRKQVDGFPTLRTEKLLKWTPKNDKISKLPEFNQLDFLVHSLPLPIISEKSTHTFWAILPTRRQTNTDEGSITTHGYHLPQRDPRDAPPDAYRGRDVRRWMLNMTNLTGLSVDVRKYYQVDWRQTLVYHTERPRLSN